MFPVSSAIFLLVVGEALYFLGALGRYYDLDGNRWITTYSAIYIGRTMLYLGATIIHGAFFYILYNVVQAVCAG